MAGSRVLAFIGREMREMIPPTLVFAVGFNLIVLTGHLLIDDYGRQLANFMVATTSALVVGKSVLLANAMPLLRRFDGAPLIMPILFKTLVYTAVVMVVRLLEVLVESWVAEGGAIVGFRSAEAHFTWHRFVAVQIWILVLFLIYVTIDELNTLFGGGELRRVFFTWSPPTLKLSRQQRMRALARINRLAREHGADELHDRSSAPGAELFHLIDELGRQASRAVAGRSRAA